MAEAYFVAGGTVPPGSPSYVERLADHELFEALVAGEYCYVLNSRQMGKSSLAVRMVQRLKPLGVQTAFIDLTRIGGVNVTPEQWYAGLLAETGRVLGLRSQAAAYLKAHDDMGPAQRFLGFLQEVALGDSGKSLVVMIDEIDAVRSLSFSTDELFAGIRQLHNGRASEPTLNRLTFCLLGAALPGDLIRDARTTPFNVGRNIELKDFSAQEAKAFARGLSLPSPEAVVDRVLYWTGGHPFLTQTLCGVVATEPGAPVDRLVKERYLGARAKESDTNLVDVGNRLLGRGDPAVTELDRANTLSLYSKLLKGGVPEDESNPACARIKMSGVSRLADGRLAIRNRIYERVFGASWVKDNMPGQELRRQRRAYFAGMLRTGAVAAVVLSVIGTLAILAIENAGRANRAELKARRETYAATMRNMIQWQDQHDLFLVNRAATRLKDEPWRGWEWAYWNRTANQALKTLRFGQYYNGSFNVSPDGLKVLTYGPRGVSLLDLTTGRLLWEHRIDIFFISTCVTWSRDSKRILVYPQGGEVRVLDAADGATISSGSNIPGLLAATGFGPSTLLGDHSQIVTTPDYLPALFDLTTHKIAPIDLPGNRRCEDGAVVSKDGRLALIPCGPAANSDSDLAIVDLRTLRTRKIVAFGAATFFIAISDDSKFCAAATTAGSILLIDLNSGQVIDRQSVPGAGAIFFSSDSRYVVATGSERESVVFDIENRTLRERSRFMESLEGQFIPSTHRLLTSFWDFRIYDVDAPPAVPEVRLAPDSYAGTVTGDGKLVAGSLTARTVNSLGTAGSVTTKLRGVVGIKIDIRGRREAVDYGDHTEIVDVATGTTLRRWAHPLTAVLSFSCSPDGKYAVLPGDFKTLQLIDLGTAAPTTTILSNSRATTSCFSEDSRYVAFAAQDGSIACVEARTGRQLWAYQPGGLQYDCVVFSPDGSRLAAGNDGDTADILDAASGKLLAHLVGHFQSVNCAAWSADGTRLATGSNDTTVHLWDPGSGDDLGIIGRHPSGVVAVGFLPGGRTLASFSADGLAKLWKSQERL